MPAYYDKFLKRIEAHKKETKVIREGLAQSGPALISDLQDRDGFASHSLRAVAREVGYSAAYLCDIMHGRRIVSPRAFRRLVELLRESKEAK